VVTHHDAINARFERAQRVASREDALQPHRMQ
jgi:hypothetical protein